MSKKSEFEIIQKFHECVERGDLTGDIKFIFQIAGGMPHERVEKEFKLTGTGKAKVMVRDVLRTIPTKEVSVELDRAKTCDLFQKIVPGLDSLVPRTEASFLPDSLVGSITIQVGKEKTTLFFLADEEDRKLQNKPIEPQMAEVIQHFTKLSKQLMKSGEKK